MPLEEDQATAKDNMHKNEKKFGVIPEICSRTDKQTHTHTCHTTPLSYAVFGQQ